MDVGQRLLAKDKRSLFYNFSEDTKGECLLSPRAAARVSQIGRA